MYLNFEKIPTLKNLSIDFINEPQKLAEFGIKDFRDLNVINAQIQQIASQDFPHRLKLVEIIREQYADKTPSEKTKKNISLLALNKTFAVISAQQIGLFGGPLQYFYKIISTIKLAEKYNRIFSDYHFVPVFWLESEDHGFENASKTYAYNYDKAIRKIEYNDNLPDDYNRGAFGDLIVGENIKSTFAQLEETLHKTSHTTRLLDLLKNSYAEGKTFKEAFGNLLFELFDSYGLIIFEPSSQIVKSLVKDLFKESVSNYSELYALGVKRSALLEENYEAQIKIHPVNLFFHSDDGRFRIEPHEKGLRIGNKRKVWSQEEMLELIDEAPELFSPDVVFRPLMQDLIFPNVAAIAGFNEMNYFPQIIPYYEYFNIVTPLLYPRASVTVNENFLQKKIDKYELSLSEIFQFSENELVRRILTGKSENDLERIFAIVSADIDYSLDSLSEQLSELNINLQKPIDEVKEGIYKLLGMLREQADKTTSTKEQNILRHVKILKNQFLPFGKLQEDVINFAYFANQYGLGFLDKIFDEISIDEFEHQIITI